MLLLSFTSNKLFDSINLNESEEQAHQDSLD